MSGENGGLTNENHDHDPKRRISRLDPNALIQGLERLRESIEKRFGALEAMARERAAMPAPTASELERRLQERITENEEAAQRLRALAERREQEWRTALEQLEGDRRLLAEAWQRLEREQLEAPAPAQTQKGGRAPAADRGSAPVRPRLEGNDPANDLVARAILKQFHALRNDVRRNAKQRGSV